MSCLATAECGEVTPRAAPTVMKRLPAEGNGGEVIRWLTSLGAVK